MAAKLAFLILTIAFSGASLLAVRQQRIQVVHEMTGHLRRAEETDRATWRVRAELAKSLTPERLREALDETIESSPMIDEYCPPGTLLYDEYAFLGAGE